jgi:hypothetical protein
MSNGSVTATTAVNLSGMQPAPAVQPTAQQAARFEQQLQIPASTGPQYYQAPPVEAAGLADNWRSLMNGVGQMADQFRADAEALKGTQSSVDTTPTGSQRALDARQTAEIFEKNMSQLSHMSYTMLNMSFITTAERLAGENVRSLYQLG